eukprot:767683-Hanusia_phi.AAC.3
MRESDDDRGAGSREQGAGKTTRNEGDGGLKKNEMGGGQEQLLWMKKSGDEIGQEEEIRRGSEGVRDCGGAGESFSCRKRANDSQEDGSKSSSLQETLTDDKGIGIRAGEEQVKEKKKLQDSPCLSLSADLSYQ